MKKRIACLLMTLIMLVSLVPAAALTASAASLSTSAAAITVLKKLTTFREGCYQVANTQEVRIGYGTICEEDHKFEKNSAGEYELSSGHHTIKENVADAALRKALADYDKKVNSFASSNKLSLTQSQHDALVLYSYRVGTAWMNGNGVLKTALISNADTNALLKAWGTDSRSLIEVNMYVNGVYSNVVPSSFKKVTYNANSGAIVEGSPYTMYFDTTKTVSHIPTPTKNGYTFLGWYVDKDGNGEGDTWAPSLTSDCAGKTLYALWQKNGRTAAYANNNPVVSYSLAKSRLSSTKIYSIPDVKEGKDSGKVTADSVTIDCDYIGADGTRWAHIKSTGWVIVIAGKDGVPSSGTEIDVTVTVTNSYVNMRKNATVYSAQNGKWNKGDELRIINTDSADGFLWGQVAKSTEDDTAIGWVALVYTNWNDVKDGANAGDNSNNTSKAIARATITFNGYVNVRSDAGTDNKIVGALAYNNTVDVFEIKTVNGHQWGRTTSGWFCLTYAKVSMLVSDSKVSDEGALAYTFTGTSAGGKVHVAPGTNTNYVKFTDAKGNAYSGIPTGKTTSVTITNMKLVDGVVWAKATWKNPEKDKDNKDITVTRSGWVILPGVEAVAMASTENTTATVKLDPVRYTVASDEVSVRTEPNNSSDLVIKLNKGVEIEVTHITLVGENIWGYTANEYDVHPYSGYVNLASKYLTRTTLPEVENADPDMGLMATVINTDNVKVRNYGSTTSGKVIGSLARGTTVAVWETNDDKSWYKIDTNKNGSYDYEGDGWVSAQYLEITKASSGGSSSGSGDSSATRTTGTGIVANTYAGVNVRSGAGIGNAPVGKLLPGTVVEILETKTVGASKWGRITQGWVCMDYITMISYDEIPGGSVTTPSGNGTVVGSLDDVEKTTTTAVYTGTIKGSESVNVYASTALKTAILNDEDVVQVLNPGDHITMYELLAVTDIINDDVDKENNNGGTVTTTTKTSFWARINEGYIYCPGDVLALDGLDEKVHTLTGSDTLNIRASYSTDSEKIGELKKGDQVTVTKLQIVSDKVWGWAETKTGDEGWIRLDYMSEGAYYVQQTPAATAPTTPPPTIGSTGNTGEGGFVTNTSGYKYTGKVIRNGTTALKVRSTPSTSATVTTSLDNGASLVIYETTVSDGMIWGRCDAGWVYLYYVDLTPCSGSAIDAKVVYTENAIVYTDSSCSEVAGTYARMSLVDIYEVVGNMSRTDLGWVNNNDIA